MDSRTTIIDRIVQQAQYNSPNVQKAASQSMALVHQWRSQKGAIVIPPWVIIPSHAKHPPLK